ncbi:MAG: primosomal protein N' [Lachnospiraceae bacterium]|nr:primosomal protein N' [Lachnospiraceae bacterium]
MESTDFCYMTERTGKHMKDILYADVVIDISHEALDKVFQYRVPFSLREKVIPGVRVCVPFGRGNRETEGYVIAIGRETDYDPDKIKEISYVVPGSLSVESQLIQVADFLKKQYGSSMIAALRTVMPVKNKVRHKEEMTISLGISLEQAQQLLTSWEKKHYCARVRFLKRLLEKGTILKEEAVKECKLSMKDLRKLEHEGIIHMSTKVLYRNPFQDFRVMEQSVCLNEEQQYIAEDFQKRYLRGEQNTYLLYGVTGSGKTEVYLALIQTILRDGKQAIVLIPEISLTYQTVRRFYERFGDQIAVIHSRMSMGEKSDACERIRQGDANVVIGARSALFAPTKNLGLIIIDEEHDNAYKSDTSPKYHARETAIFRAGLAGASVVLGSATPSVESFSRAQNGEYILWTMKKRAGDASLPDVLIEDLREEFQKGNRSVFSEVLYAKMEERLKKKEQIMLFLNRRGFAGFVSCRNCGIVVKCPHCDVSLTYHRNGRLRCHYCGYETAFSRQCPVCKSPHVAAFGLGTEKVEAALHQEFPEAKIIRMDMDTTRRKNAHQQMLKAFSAGDADILLGTQMIVKGHDYPNVTLVGILAADLSLHGQDFRSGERTFQLLCQAAGRAGRGQKKGEVVIQTYSPDHYAITTAAEHSYDLFYEQEYAYRSLMGYPPCAHLLVILIQCADESQAVLTVMRIQKMVQQSQQDELDTVQILNPGEAVISKLKDMYRKVLYLKHKDAERLLDLKDRLEPVLEKHPLFAGVQIQFDFDPMNFY